MENMKKAYNDVENTDQSSQRAGSKNWAINTKSYQRKHSKHTGRQVGDKPETLRAENAMGDKCEIMRTKAFTEFSVYWETIGGQMKTNRRIQFVPQLAPWSSLVTPERSPD